MADDPSIETHLRNLAEQFGTARDLKACIAIDIQFHRTLSKRVVCSRSWPLVTCWRSFFSGFARPSGKLSFGKSASNHLRLVDLLAAGRVDAASAELREQIESNKERL
jgi:DNA-binding FadR family transcriptional regulator